MFFLYKSLRVNVIVTIIINYLILYVKNTHIINL